MFGQNLVPKYWKLEPPVSIFQKKLKSTTLGVKILIAPKMPQRGPSGLNPFGLKHPWG